MMNKSELKDYLDTIAFICEYEGPCPVCPLQGKCHKMMLEATAKCIRSNPDMKRKLNQLAGGMTDDILKKFTTTIPQVTNNYARQFNQEPKGISGKPERKTNQVCSHSGKRLKILFRSGRIVSHKRISRKAYNTIYGSIEA